MNDEDRLSDLLLQWEEAYDRGQEPSSADICRDCPELATRLEELIRSLKALEWMKHEPPYEFSHVDAPVAPSAGRRILAGRFRLDSALGEGGFGQVWRGYDLELHRPVAVKLPKKRCSGPDAILEEARKVARLKHPGIVAVHDVGQDGGDFFIVADLIDGGSLADCLRKGRLPLQEAARIVAEAAEALDYAHRQRFIHRDLKPANILLDTQGRVFFTDFGIGAGQGEILNERSGTAAYMAPEQVAGEPHPDIGGDVYSLGVVLYQLLTGRLPFEAQTHAELRTQILSHPPDRPRRLDRTIPAALERVCLKCLAKRPEERFASARELATALKEIALPTSHGRIGLAVFTVGLTCAAVLLMVFLIMRSGQEPHEAIKHEGHRELKDWVQLFNGKDLTGWKVFPGQPLDWKVENGMLVGTGNDTISHLFSERGDYYHFRLRVEARISDGGNSGILIRSRFARDFFPGGFGSFEAQIASTPPDPWNKRVRTGSLVTNENEVLARVEDMLVPPDTWFSQEVVVSQNRIMVKVNEEVTADVQHRKIDAKDGYLALQRWYDTTVSFRKIEIAVEGRDE